MVFLPEAGSWVDSSEFTGMSGNRSLVVEARVGTQMDEGSQAAEGIPSRDVVTQDQSEVDADDDEEMIDVRSKSLKVS